MTGHINLTITFVFHILKSLLNTHPTGPAAFCRNNFPVAKTNREREQKPLFGVDSNFILLVKSHRLLRGLTSLVPLSTPITPPRSCVLLLTRTYPDTHSSRERLGLPRKPSRIKGGVREPGYLVEHSCPLLSLPLTPA